jgi:hypothetical protein
VDSCNPYPYGWATPEVLQYLGTDTEILLYGELAWNGNAYGYVNGFTAAEPRKCAVSVESKTWSQLKQLYRD